LGWFNLLISLIFYFFDYLDFIDSISGILTASLVGVTFNGVDVGGTGLRSFFFNDIFYFKI
jgi:hypothetical protein